KSNPTQPGPRLGGSPDTRPCATGPGTPIDTTSCFQSPVAASTISTIRCGVICLPDGNDRFVRFPETRNFTFVPPTSITSAFTIHFNRSLLSNQIAPVRLLRFIVSMQLAAASAPLEAILAWRDLYRQEMNCQIIHDSIHARPGWSREYMLHVGETPVGYGSVAIGGPWKNEPAIYEFYVLPQFRSRLFDL